jgi:hypothetical protein
MPIVKQFGFSTKTGVVANMVDGDEVTGWAPLATDLRTYPDPFVAGGALNVGHSFAALELDFGTPVHMNAFIIEVETALTIGAAVLIGSDNPATSPADTLQAGDILFGQYTQEEMVSNHVLLTDLTATGINKRYYRLLQRSSRPEDGPPGGTDPGTLDDSGPNFQQFNSHAGTFNAPSDGSYTDKFIIELWGSGATGGLTSLGADGHDTTCTTYSLTAGGGKKSTSNVFNSGAGGAGGVASGGNTENTNGQAGGTPSPTTDASGVTGAGGSSPHGGAGGSAVSSPSIVGGYFNSGISGAAPGGGGSGSAFQTQHISGSPSQAKQPGGGGGAYVKHVLTKGVDGPANGDPVAFSVGAGVTDTSGSGNGAGASGRVRFSWT